MLEFVNISRLCVDLLGRVFIRHLVEMHQAFGKDEPRPLRACCTRINVWGRRLLLLWFRRHLFMHARPCLSLLSPSPSPLFCARPLLQYP